MVGVYLILKDMKVAIGVSNSLYNAYWSFNHHQGCQYYIRASTRN